MTVVNQGPHSKWLYTILLRTSTLYTFIDLFMSDNSLSLELAQSSDISLRSEWDQSEHPVWYRWHMS